MRKIFIQVNLVKNSEPVVRMTKITLISESWLEVPSRNKSILMFAQRKYPGIDYEA